MLLVAVNQCDGITHDREVKGGAREVARDRPSGRRADPGCVVRVAEHNAQRGRRRLRNERPDHHAVPAQYLPTGCGSPHAPRHHADCRCAARAAVTDTGFAPAPPHLARRHWQTTRPCLRAPRARCRRRTRTARAEHHDRAASSLAAGQAAAARREPSPPPPPPGGSAQAQAVRLGMPPARPRRARWARPLRWRVPGPPLARARTQRRADVTLILAPHVPESETRSVGAPSFCQCRRGTDTHQNGDPVTRPELRACLTLAAMGLRSRVTGPLLRAEPAAHRTCSRRTATVSACDVSLRRRARVRVCARV